MSKRPSSPGPDNPFRFGLILHGDDGYCPRPELERVVATTASSSGRLAVYGERRMGKSSLVVHGLQKRGEFYVHVDLWAVNSVEDFARRLSDAYERALVEHLTGTFKGHAKSWLNGIKDALRTIQVSFNMGGVGASVNLERSQPGKSLTDVFKVLEKHSREEPVTVFLDEVQDLNGLKPDESKLSLGLLRSQMQIQGRVGWVFSGSNTPQMRGLFEDPKGALYGSTNSLQVGPIPPVDFLKWITHRFKSGSRTLPPEIAPLLFELAGDKPNDVQRLCSEIWNASRPGDVLGLPHLKQALRTVLFSVKEPAETLMRQASASQRRALVTLAHMGSNLSEATLKQLGFRGEASFRRLLEPFLSRANPVLELSENRIVFSSPFQRAWIASQETLSTFIGEAQRRIHFANVLLNSGEDAGKGTKINDSPFVLEEGDARESPRMQRMRRAI